MTVSIVTGGAGFIGSHVARSLVEMGHDVLVLDDLSGGFADNVPAGATLIEGSVVDHQLVNGLFDQYEFDYVFHLAAYAAEGLSHFIRRFNYTNNVVGSVNMINAAVAHKAKRFVFTSSIAVYGENQLPMVEDLIPSPEDPYGVAKYAVEMDLLAAYKMFGLEYTIFRPHNVYGEHQNTGDKYRNVVGIFMNQVMQAKPMTIFGDGSQTRAFSYIDDVAPLIARSVQMSETAGEVFNIGADTPYSVLQLAGVVADAFGIKPEIEFLPARNEVLHVYASHEKVDRFFGERSPTELSAGVEKMARWARSVGPRQTREFAGIEVWDNLPASWRSAVKSED